MTRVVILGCVKTKQPPAAGASVPAATLYKGPLWQRRLAYAKSSGHPWRILSARHGLINPEIPISWYETQLHEQPAHKLHVLAEVSRSRLWRDFCPWTRGLAERAGMADVTVEFHAGRPYVEWLRPGLEEWGFTIQTPLCGLPIGRQLHWYESGQLAIPIEGEPNA